MNHKKYILQVIYHFGRIDGRSIRQEVASMTGWNPDGISSAISKMCGEGRIKKTGDYYAVTLAGIQLMNSKRAPRYRAHRAAPKKPKKRPVKIFDYRHLPEWQWLLTAGRNHQHSARL